jgi:formate-dependent nitrite reductase membrane component NrfD
MRPSRILRAGHRPARPAASIVSWLMEQLVEWLTTMTLGFLDFTLVLLTNLIWYVPDVTVLPGVRVVWVQNMTIVNTVHILLVIAAGVIAMTYDSFQVRYGVQEQLPRLVLGAVAANSPSAC